MEAGVTFPSMGATLFFGLTFVALITQGAPEIEYANPVVTMSETKLDGAPAEVVRVGQVSWPLPALLADVQLNEALPSALTLASEAGQLAIGAQTSALQPNLSAEIKHHLQTPKTTGLGVLVDVPDAQRAPSSISGLGAVQSSNTAGVATNAAPATRPKGLSSTVQKPRVAEDTSNAVRIAPPSTITQRTPTTPLGTLALKDENAPTLYTQPNERLSLQTQLDRDADEPVVPRLSLEAPQAEAPAPTSSIVQLTPLNPDGLPALQPEPIPGIVSGDRVFLRTGPSVSAEPLGQFDTGTPALIREARGPWLRVEINSQTGWMFGEFVVVESSN